MAREYDPPPGPAPVRVEFSTDKRRVGDRKITIHIARCKEDGHRATGDTQAEAARYFAQHMGHKHPRQTIRKV